MGVLRAGLLTFVVALVFAAPADAQQLSIFNVGGPGAVTEGNSGSTPVAFTITRSGDTSHSAGVGFSTCCGTADAGFDYATGGGFANFNPGETTYTTNFDIQGDTRVEPDETYALRLANPSNATIGPNGQANVKIVDDDGRAPGTHIDVSDPTPIAEGAAGQTAQVTFVLTLSNNSHTVPMTIDYATADGTAIAGEDYTAKSGSVTFNPGQTTKTVSVDVTGDDGFEGDEDFTLNLSNPTAAGPGDGTGRATIVNDDPVPPPPASPSEHTVLGTVTYEPAFGVGYLGVGVLGPFAAPSVAEPLTVTLEGPGGGALATQRLSPRDGGDRSGNRSSPVLYRFDNLGACDGCRVVLRSAGDVQDARPVSFSGDAGQTDADLVFGAATQGGVVDGIVLGPPGGVRGLASVAIEDAGGRVLADTSRLKLNCGKGKEDLCDTGDSLPYRLTGLPRDATPVRAVLMQSSNGRRPVEVDSAAFTLDPNGQSRAPDLTAIADPPSSASGRTLFGQIAFRAPFAPGARAKGDLDLPRSNLKDFTTELRDSGDKTVAKLRGFTRTSGGYTGYEFTKLPACEGCSVVGLDGRKVVGRTAVTIPSESPSVTRRDLSYRIAGDPEFVDGEIHAGRGSARRLSVVVTDPATGEKLASSEEGTQACAREARCPNGGDLLYRLGGAPADRDVLLTLNNGGKPVDSRLVHLAPAGEVTQAPALTVPRGKGPRSLEGDILNGGPFPPGGKAPEQSGGITLAARLLDANQNEVQRTSIRKGGDSFLLDNLPACADCTLELLRNGDSVDDRVPVTIRPESPSVTQADLRWDAITGGAYVQGDLVLRRRSTAGEIRVQVLDDAGKVLADSAKLRGAKGGGASPAVRDKGTYPYRLGGIPRTVGKVRVVVLQRSTRIGSTSVTLAPGNADTAVPDIKVDPR